MTTGLYLRLSLMMFLEWFIMGAWYVTVGNYMARIGMASSIYWAYTVVPISALISPYFMGLAADRYCATQKLLGLLHLLGGLALFVSPWAAEPPIGSVPVFIGLLLAHSLCFAPTIALTSSLAFHHLTNPEKQFPLIRVFGTIGWIVAGQLLNLFGEKTTTTPISFQLAVGMSLVLGFYCLTLPHTPPKGAGQPVTARDILGVDALQLLKDPSFAVFVVLAFLFCIPINLYFSFTTIFLEDVGIGNIPATMTLGQMSEIFFMIVMPFFLAHLGIKWVFVTSLCAWTLRYLLFYLGYNSGSAWPLYLGVAIHGMCYVFFFVLAFIYVDKKAPEAIRTKAQGFISLVTMGGCFFVGSIINGKVVGEFNFPNAAPDKFIVAAKEAKVGKGDFVVWEANNLANYGRITQPPSETAALVEVFRVANGAFGSSGQTNSVPVNTLAKAMFWGAGDYVKWEANGVAAYGKVAKLEADTQGKITVAVEPYQPSGKAFVLSGKTESVQLNALSKPMTLWGGIWRLAVGVGVVVLVLFTLLFKHQEEPKKP